MLGALAFGEALSGTAWAGVAAATVGVTIVSWPRQAQTRGAFEGAMLGLASGAAFAVTLNAYRQSGLALEPDHPIYAATASVCVAQALQSVVLTLILAAVRPASLVAVIGSWRQSLGAGIFGSAASACWFAALAQAPAAAVRAVGVVEIPVAALAGARLFKEAMTLRQILGAVLAAAGVVATALG